MEILKRYLVILAIFLSTMGIGHARSADPVSGLAERICPGSSKHFVFEIEDELSEKDFFTLDNKGSKIRIAGNNWISIATGLNWYLKYYANANITWGNMKQTIVRFPKVAEPVRHETEYLVRYYFSYNTFTYSTPFWNWKRWQEEIDFMALHGVNTPLALTGSHSVWFRTLERLGYTREEARKFLGDATHEAQVLQGVMEGCADSISEDWFARQEILAGKILDEYEKWGMNPVLPGFTAIVPSNFHEKTGCSTIDMGTWGGYNRPSVLNPADPRFAEIAAIYYEELHRYFGKAKYYSVNPLIDSRQMGQALWKCMDIASPESICITTGWKDKPKTTTIDGIPAGRLIILDYESETRPKWGDPSSPDYSEDGYIYHNWAFCQKINYGGRVGMYGKMQRLINSFFSAKKEEAGRNMVGIGATMDAVDNNPVMWELLFELPWRKNKFLAYDWVKQFIHARYGHNSENLVNAWNLILETLYSPSNENLQEGPSESVFCARPALVVHNVSKNGTTKRYYDTEKVRRALELLLSESEHLKFSENYNYDIVMLASTVNSDYAQTLLGEIEASFGKGDTIKMEANCDKFLNLITLQNTIMNCRKETMVGSWIESSMASGGSIEESNLLRRDARRLVTTWGDHQCANLAGMHDYSHREWGGLLKDFYYERWRAFFSYIKKHHAIPVGYDYFDMENDWVEAENPYSFTPTTGSAGIARHIIGNTK